MNLDPITLEIVMARFSEICATMEHVLFHSGYSTILRARTDDGLLGDLRRQRLRLGLRWAGRCTCSPSITRCAR